MYSGLPEKITWFRLPEFVQQLRDSVLALETPNLNPEFTTTHITDSLTIGDVNTPPFGQSFYHEKTVGSGTLIFSENFITKTASGGADVFYGQRNKTVYTGANNIVRNYAIVNESYDESTGGTTSLLLSQFNQTFCKGAGAITGAYGGANYVEVEPENTANIAYAVGLYNSVSMNSGAGGTVDEIWATYSTIRNNSSIIPNTAYAAYLSASGSGDFNELTYLYISGFATGAVTKAIDSPADIPSTFGGSLEAKVLKTQGFTVSTLPATPEIGMRAYVTDASTPTFRATVTGGGAEFTPVIYDGTNWICA